MLFNLLIGFVAGLIIGLIGPYLYFHKSRSANGKLIDIYMELFRIERDADPRVKVQIYKVTNRIRNLL